jgi:putative transposase
MQAIEHSAGRQAMIEWTSKPLSIRRQCELLGVGRSTAYENRDVRKATEMDLELARRIDELHHKDPTMGSRRMAKVLRREGRDVGRKRVQRLMRTMGIEPIYPRKKLTQPGPNHRIYPYLLRNVTVSECDQVWCTDITYIPMKRGFLYLVAIMDWHSRKVLAWRLSNTLDTRFCLEALEEAIEHTGRKPRIFNTDQGCQFTSKEWTERIVELEISISMDGKGAWRDNVIVERFWRTLKYEEVYLKAYTDAQDAAQQIGEFIERYNTWRPHSAHDELVPEEVYAHAA